MDPELFISRVLDDERLTADLEEPEAQELLSWLLERVRQIARASSTESAAWKEIEALCRRAQAIGRIVDLWSRHNDREAARHLASKENLKIPVAETTEAAAMLRWLLAHA